jgi:SAM-dependent methyltransferase
MFQDFQLLEEYLQSLLKAGMSNMSETVCPVCSSEDKSFLKKYQYKSAVFSNCKIVVCNNCSMEFADPMPADETLHQYNANYFENAHGGISVNPLTMAFHSAINLLRVIYVESFQKKINRPVKNVLEIGPSVGNFAKHWLMRNNETARYVVIESDVICHPALRGLGVEVYAGIDQLPVDISFDLVVISHVLEHTSNPEAFIKEYTKRLLKGGILFVEVPCKDHEHKPIVEPHLLFFDKKPMKLFLSKLGFSQEKISYHGNKISDLKIPATFFQRVYNKGRNFLLGKGILFPFSSIEPGLEGIADPLGRACVKPFKAHVEQIEPSWWLRAVAIKN